MAICGFVVGLAIWDSDTFQQYVFPKKYWAKRVEELESQIKTHERLLESCEIKLISEKRRIPPEESLLPQYPDTKLSKTYKMLDEMENKVRLQTTKDLELEIELIKKRLSESKERLERIRQDFLRYE